MSQTEAVTLDPTSQAWRNSDRSTWGQVFDLTTDGVPPAERLAFWREVVLRRMEPVRTIDEGRPFRARLRRIVSSGIEVVEHASEGLLAVRSQKRCGQDGCDDISIDLMVSCQHADLSHVSERRVRSGDLSILDYARPIEVLRSRHRAAGLIIPRQRVREVVGNDLSMLPHMRPASRGIWALLQSQMKLILDEAHHLSLDQRLLAIAAATDMALAALQADCGKNADCEQFADGFHQAAHILIRRECGDPNLTPDTVVASLACSRASLYRVFLSHGESVAAVIWDARLKRARQMLSSSSSRHLSIAEIAFQSGFVEHTTFSRMFKRCFGMTPREARESNARRLE